MRCYWIHDGEESLNIAGNYKWILCTGLSDCVALFDTQEMVEKDNDVFDLHLGVALVRFIQSFLDFVIHKVLPKRVLRDIIRSKVKRFSSQVGLNPLLQDEQLEDGGVSNLLIEIGVIEGVSCIGECDSARICSELVDTLSHSQEVTRAL